MAEYAAKFDRNARKEVNPQYRHYQRKKERAKKALKSAVSLEQRKLLVGQLRKYDNLMLQTPAKNDMDCNYKRLKYVRYADDFLCGLKVVGNSGSIIDWLGTGMTLSKPPCLKARS